MIQIEVQNVSFAYGSAATRKNVLSNISLSVQKGEFVAIVGPTGSGKSTLLQMFAGILAPDQGKILLDSKNINEKNVSRKWLCHKIGLAFQYPERQLFEETVIRDVMFGPKNLGYNDAEAEERARLVLKQMRITERCFYSSPFRLSGGEQRKVALAGILAMEPEILVLDEPAAGLDPAAKQGLMELLKERNEAGQTVIFVSHDMDEVCENCSRIAVMQRGKIIKTGTPEEVFNGEQIENLSSPLIANLKKSLEANGVDLNCKLTADDFINAVSEEYLKRTNK